MHGCIKKCICMFSDHCTLNVPKAKGDSAAVRKDHDDSVSLGETLELWGTFIFLHQALALTLTDSVVGVTDYIPLHLTHSSAPLLHIHTLTPIVCHPAHTHTHTHSAHTPSFRGSDKKITTTSHLPTCWSGGRDVKNIKLYFHKVAAIVCASPHLLSAAII